MKSIGSTAARNTGWWRVAVKPSKLSPVVGRLVLRLRVGNRPVVEVSAPIEDLRRYPSCVALRRVYPSGVSSSLVRAERFLHTRVSRQAGRPMVASRVYSLNRELDSDREGIVCER